MAPLPWAACQLLDQVGPGDAQCVRYQLRRKPPDGGDGNCQLGFPPPSSGQRFLENLHLQGLAAEQAFQRAPGLFQLAGAACGGDALIGPDRDLTTFGHQTPPAKQQAPSHALQAGDGRYRHSRLHNLLDHPELLLGRVAPAALASGDDFDRLEVVRHRGMPSLTVAPRVRSKWDPPQA